MRPSTFNAIKTLLRMDRTVTEKERTAIISAATENKAATDALARAALDGAWMKSSDVCALLDINRSTLARWIGARTLVGKKRGKCWYVTTESVRALVADMDADNERESPAGGVQSQVPRNGEAEADAHRVCRESVAQEGTCSNFWK